MLPSETNATDTHSKSETSLLLLESTSSNDAAPPPPLTQSTLENKQEPDSLSEPNNEIVYTNENYNPKDSLHKLHHHMETESDLPIQEIDTYHYQRHAYSHSSTHILHRDYRSLISALSNLSIQYNLGVIAPALLLLDHRKLCEKYAVRINK